MASGMPPGAILGLFSSLRGSIFQPPESNLRNILGAFCGDVLRSELQRLAGFLRECLLFWEHVPRNFSLLSRDFQEILDGRGVTETLPDETAGEGA